MGKRYLVDTNVLIDFIGSVLPGAVHSKISEIINEDFNISFVNKIEVLGYNATNQGWIDFINEATMIGIDDDIIAETIRIRKNHKIKLPDAIVGATAVVYDLILLTRNTKDFINIKATKIENPWLW